MATNRLRKRLEDADDKTLSRMTENFCMIGTPLPSLDSKKDANEFKPVWEQEVRDDLGRRRFHGAFTGGFSAGYYNSVGSKEGWTPSTFRSSRKDKEKRSAEEKAMGSKPEDFMDEEDLVSFREGRGALSSSQTYAMDQQQSRQERDPLMDILGMQPERNSTVQVERQDLSTSIQIASTSLGTRLLQRMGWRPGQGLGPRVTFKRRGELLKMLGKAQEKEEAEDEEAQKHLWPPPDTPMPSFSPKSDPKGLGWVGEVRGAGLNEALKRARAEEGTGASHKLKSRGGFGLGALEEDSDGEDNVYSTGTSIEQSTLARKPHDTWASREEHIILGRHPATKNALGNGATDSEREKTSSSLDNKWHDGRPVLEGFQIAVRPSEKDPWFEAPLIPPGWSPNPDEVWSRAATETGRAKLVGQLGSADRASILGEARLPGPPPSILDYLSQKDKERLRRGTEAAASLSKKPSATTIDAPAPTEETWAKIPKLDSAVAQSALQGYVPFASEPEKQQRYREYLTSQAQPGEKKLRAAIGQTQAQFIAELHDFAKSASIFKPMSTIMASRFQSSSSVASDLPTINPGLHIPERRPVLSVEEQKAKAEAERKVEEEKKTQDEMQSLTSLQRNARLGLFGKDTTREIKVWKPNRLLCKRFNVPTPYPDDEDTKSTDDKAETENDMEAAFGVKKIRQMDVPKVNARWEESKRQLFQLAAQRSWEGDGVSSAERQDALHEDRELKVGGEKSKPTVGYADVDNIGLGEVARDQEEETFVKPPLDVFKAVFADDDSDDEDEVEIKPVQSAGDEFSDLGKQQSSTAVNGGRKTATSDKSRVTPPPAPEEGPNDQDPTRPLFVPRKRPAEESKKSFAGKELKKKKKEKDKGKGKGKGLLTFSVDDEDEEGSEVDTPRTRTVKINRPRAADLF